MANEILKEALIAAMDKELEGIPSNLADYHSFSSGFEKKMKQLIKKAKIKYISINRFRIRRSIAAASLILIILTASMSVEAVRMPIIRLTEKIYTEFSEIIFENEDNIEVPEKIEEVYVPSYIPEGYTLKEEVNDMRSMHFFFYTNEEGQELSVEQLVLGVHMSVDTEGITTEEITINGLSGIIYTKRGLTSIIVNDNRYVHFISGYESREELIKIVESLHVRK